MAHHKVVAAQEVLLRAGRSDGWRQTIGDREVSVQESEEQKGEQHYQGHLGAEHRDEHVLVAEGIEPEVVRPESRKATQRQHQDEQCRHDTSGHHSQLRGAPGTALPLAGERSRTGRRGVFRAHG